MKCLLIGTRISNITLSRRLAEAGHLIRILDCKDHIGGNCYDYFDENNIDVHAYARISSTQITLKSGPSYPNLRNGILTSMK